MMFGLSIQIIWNRKNMKAITKAADNGYSIIILSNDHPLPVIKPTFQKIYRGILPMYAKDDIINAIGVP
jgi:histidinol phosphatase-like enzyme